MPSPKAVDLGPDDVAVDVGASQRGPEVGRDRERTEHEHFVVGIGVAGLACLDEVEEDAVPPGGT